MASDRSILRKLTVSLLVRMVDEGEIQLGEAIDAAFLHDLWGSLPNEEKERLVHLFIGIANGTTTPGLSPGEAFLFFYVGLKVEDALHQSDPQKARQVLALLLTSYSDSKSRILANAFHLFLADLVLEQALDGREAFSSAIALADHALAVLPDGAQRELQYALRILAGSLRGQFVMWMRHLHPLHAGSATTPFAREQLVETSIEQLRRALHLWSLQEHPSAWTRTALLLVDSLLLDSPAVQSRLEEARLLCEQIVEIPVVHLEGVHLGGVFNSLGMIFNERAQGDRKKNVEQSIDYYRRALEDPDHFANPHTRSMTQTNLGNSYLDWPDTDVEKNILIAIECYKQALSVRTRDEYPYEWAMTTTCLGVAYAELGKTRHDLQSFQLSRRHLSDSLQVFEEHLHPSEHSGAVSNLGVVALCIYQMTQDEAALVEAVERLRQASELSLVSNPTTYVSTLSHLIALACTDSTVSNVPDIDLILETLAARFSALELPPTHFSFYQLQLGKYWFRRLELLGLDSAEDSASFEYQQACGALQNALDTYYRLRDYESALDAATHLSRLFRNARMLAEDLALHERALEIVEQLRLTKVVEDERTSVLRDYIGFFIRAFELYLEQGLPLKALEVADRVKARAMLPAIRERHVALENSLTPDLAMQYWSLVDRQRELMATLSHLSAPRSSRISRNRLWEPPQAQQAYVAILNRELDEIETSAAERLKRLREQDPAYVRSLQAASFPDLEIFFRAHPQAAIFTLQHSSEGVHFFYLQGGANSGRPRVRTEFRTYEELRELNSALDTWFEAYNQLSLKTKLNQIAGQSESRVRRRQVMDLMEVMLDLYGEVIGPDLLQLHEDGATQLIIVPNRDSQVVPFSAVRISTPAFATKRRLITLFSEIRYLPSLSMLHTTMEGTHQLAENSSLVTAVYSPPESPLPHNAWETSALHALFAGHVAHWDGRVDCVAELLEAVTGADCVHFSVHGSTVVADYHKSHLCLGPETRLTYSDVIHQLKLERVTLVTLSACESAYTPNRLKRIAWDEYAGLDSAILQAGAKAVVASIWMAMDRSAALMMYILYAELRLHGKGSAHALTQAQRSLLEGAWKTDGTREQFNQFFTLTSDDLRIPPLGQSEDYSHPFFWANFRQLG